MKYLRKVVLSLGVLSTLSGVSFAQGLSNGSEAEGLAPSNSEALAPQNTGRVEWRGGGVYRFLSPACINVGWSLDEPVKVRFRPSGLGNNGDFTGMGFHYYTYSTGMSVNGRIATTFKQYQGAGVSGTAYGYNGFMRFTEILPAAYNANTKIIKMSIYITKWGGDAGCNVIVDATLQRRNQ